MLDVGYRRHAFQCQFPPMVRSTGRISDPNPAKKIRIRITARKNNQEVGGKKGNTGTRHARKKLLQESNIFSSFADLWVGLQSGLSCQAHKVGSARKRRHANALKWNKCISFYQEKEQDIFRQLKRFSYSE
jgi:hypothetical protein